MGKELEVYESTIDKWERGVTKPNTNNKEKNINFNIQIESILTLDLHSSISSGMSG
jgi:hypothetical protein